MWPSAMASLYYHDPLFVAYQASSLRLSTALSRWRSHLSGCLLRWSAGSGGLFRRKPGKYAEELPENPPTRADNFCPNPFPSQTTQSQWEKKGPHQTQGTAHPCHYAPCAEVLCLTKGRQPQINPKTLERQTGSPASTLLEGPSINTHGWLQHHLCPLLAGWREALWW